MEKIPEIIHESWHPYLQKLFDDKKMILMNNGVLPRNKFYPAGKDIFNVFRMPLDKIKVVILGQDPYPKGEGIGYAFAVAKETPIPSSLKIIRNEIIQSKVERDTHTNIESDEWKTLKHWRQQGVFLLNTALTVEANSPGSHGGHWQWFTREVIHTISTENVSIVWLLWGSKAIGFKDYIDHHCVMNEELIEIMSPTNGILQAPHPAAEAYDSATKYRFTGCNHFNLCNKILKIKKQTIINW